MLPGPFIFILLSRMLHRPFGMALLSLAVLLAATDCSRAQTAFQPTPANFTQGNLTTRVPLPDNPYDKLLSRIDPAKGNIQAQMQQVVVRRSQAKQQQQQAEATNLNPAYTMGALMLPRKGTIKRNGPATHTTSDGLTYGLQNCFNSIICVVQAAWNIHVSRQEPENARAHPAPQKGTGLEQDSTNAFEFGTKASIPMPFIINQVILIGSVMNWGDSDVSWAAYPAAQDTCLQAKSTTIIPGCREDTAKFALLTGRSSKTWKLVSIDGLYFKPHCGRYDTETYTTGHLYTETFWVGPPCSSITESHTFTLNKSKIGWDFGFPIGIVSLTANEFIYQGLSDSSSPHHLYRFVPQ